MVQTEPDQKPQIQTTQRIHDRGKTFLMVGLRNTCHLISVFRLTRPAVENAIERVAQCERLLVTAGSTTNM